jgi:hypothetical protein
MSKPIKKYPRRCATKRCRGIVATKRCKSPYCPKCKWRQWTAKNPLRAAFKTLRNHAKERGKEFTLTFEYFKTLAEQTDYLARKGKTSLSLQIDRKDNNEGYHDWNVQTLELRSNTRKNFVPFFSQYMQATMADTRAAIAAEYPGV